MKNIYSASFYELLQGDAKRSAREIVPLIMDLVQPKSVVDAGCALGSWLAVFTEFGVQDILGIDGDWVDRRLLEIPQEKFLTHNLTKPLHIDRKFDLAISLEVAQHFPDEALDTYVDSLTRLAPVILFSSGIPFQGPPYLNLYGRWQSDWVRHFEARSYLVVDCFRRKLWNNENVGVWYAQNMLVFCSKDYLENNDILKRERGQTNIDQLSFVHPRVWLWHKANLENKLLMKLYSRVTFQLHLLSGRVPPPVKHVVRRARRLLPPPFGHRLQHRRTG